MSDADRGPDAGENPTEQPDAAGCRRRFADRLEGAGLSVERFIDVNDGEKRSLNHTEYGPKGVVGNYGVYAGGGLVDVDIDDYGDGEPNAGLEAIRDLPETLVVQSPHTDGENGGHFYYHVTTDREPDDFDIDAVLATSGKSTAEAARDDPAALALAEAFGTPNVAPSWGEVRTVNQYCVGPGSRITKDSGGCDKEWCDDCPPAGGDGYYRFGNDAPIATVDVDDLIDALEADPETERRGATSSGSLDAYDGAGGSGGNPPTSSGTSGYDPAGTDVGDVLSEEKDLAVYIAAGPKAAGFTDDMGDGDRSKADWFACATLAEWGVAEDDARELLAGCEHSKVGSRDAAQNYWELTWRKVLASDDVEPNAKADVHTGDDGVGVGNDGSATTHPTFDVLDSDDVQLVIEPVNGSEVNVVINQNGKCAYLERKDRGFWNSRQSRATVAGAVAETITGVDQKALKTGVERALTKVSVADGDGRLDDALRPPRERSFRRRTIRVVSYPDADDGEWHVTIEPPSESPIDEPKTITVDSGGIRDLNAGAFKNAYLSTFQAKCKLDAEEWNNYTDYWLEIQETKDPEVDHHLESAVERFGDFVNQLKVWIDDDGFDLTARNGLYRENYTDETGEYGDVILVPGSRVVEWQKRENYDDMNLALELRDRGVLSRPSKRVSAGGMQRRVWFVDADETVHTADTALSAADDDSDDDERPEGLR